MTLSPGTTLGPYEITAAIGAGGMGEVYRATDTKLERDVAIKVLPAAFVEDKERLARFEREAKLLAQLNHPNIAHIYGMEASGDAHALVMELVEGPTLAERISGVAEAKRAGLKPAPTAGHAMPLDEALPIARQIAEALEYAHEHGIIHRDLKPANIKLTGPLDGDQVKILDFGLAKAMDTGAAPGSGASVDLSHSPTMTLGGTIQGMILGTAGYMAPEQAAGKAADKRADIWAFGVVLYEMLTGAKLFAGDSVPETLAGVLKGEIDLAKLPEETPWAIRRLLARCLERNPKQRLRDIGEARITIETAILGKDETGPPGAESSASERGARRAPLRQIFPWVLAALLVGALVSGLAVWKLAAPAPTSTMHFSAVTNFAGVQAQPALSPDGRSVAFVSNRDGHFNVYVGLARGGNLVQITHDPNLESAPRWSPDGATLAYARLNHWGVWDIWEVPALGGTPRRVILNAVDPAWLPTGKSLAYASLTDGGIWISGTSGEDARQVAPPLQNVYGNRGVNRQPRVSPDGHEVAFILRGVDGGPGAQLAVTELGSGKTRLLTEIGGMDLSPAWSRDGRFIYFASSRGGTVNIWKVAATGGQPEQITAGEGDDADLDVSRDGKSIVFGTLRQKVG
ncbi:MAG TPA: LpqB family beta-propeller domain-containing protein, partial [Thermoanaerobaculia bacterium]|nr:LpqB family beta-propeller domain-containing protein [Thermoanaerobaculia bacterium]